MKNFSFMDIVKNNKFQLIGLDPQIYIHNRFLSFEKNSYTNLIRISCFLNNSKGKIYNKDYRKILEKAKDGDFVFLDPPYLEEHEYGFQYNINENINSNFLTELHKEVRKLDKRGVKWIMTQADTKQVKDLFREYKIKKFQVYRMGKNRRVNELIIMNY